MGTYIFNGSLGNDAASIDQEKTTLRPFLLLLLIGLILVPSGSGAELTSVNLQHMYSREFTSSSPAITDVWLGDTTSYVVIVLQFTNVSDSGVYANVTIRDESSNPYLLSVRITQNGYTTLLQEAASFVDPKGVPGGSLLIQYVEKTVYYNPNLGELGVYVPWSDIGGRGTVDLIGWTGMDSTTESRVPSSGYIQFSGVSQVDRILEFDYALQGTYELEMNLIETSFISPTNVTTTTTQSSFTGEIIAVFAVVLAAAFILFRKYYIDAKSTEEPLKPSKSKTPIEKFVRSDDVELKYIDELGREVRMCCYQTARLEETYCYCGRAVDEDIRALFKDKS